MLPYFPVAFVKTHFLQANLHVTASTPKESAQHFLVLCDLLATKYKTKQAIRYHCPYEHEWMLLYFPVAFVKTHFLQANLHMTASTPRESAQHFLVLCDLLATKYKTKQAIRYHCPYEQSECCLTSRLHLWKHISCKRTCMWQQVHQKKVHNTFWYFVTCWPPNTRPSRLLGTIVHMNTSECCFTFRLHLWKHISCKRTCIWQQVHQGKVHNTSWYFVTCWPPNTRPSRLLGTIVHMNTSECCFTFRLHLWKHISCKRTCIWQQVHQGKVQNNFWYFVTCWPPNTRPSRLLGTIVHMNTSECCFTFRLHLWKHISCKRTCIWQQVHQGKVHNTFWYFVTCWPPNTRPSRLLGTIVHMNTSECCLTSRLHLWKHISCKRTCIWQQVHQGKVHNTFWYFVTCWPPNTRPSRLLGTIVHMNTSECCFTFRLHLWKHISCKRTCIWQQVHQGKVHNNFWHFVTCWPPNTRPSRLLGTIVHMNTRACCFTFRLHFSKHISCKRTCIWQQVHQGKVHNTFWYFVTCRPPNTRPSRLLGTTYIGDLRYFYQISLMKTGSSTYEKAFTKPMDSTPKIIAGFSHLLCSICTERIQLVFQHGYLLWWIGEVMKQTNKGLWTIGFP